MTLPRGDGISVMEEEQRKQFKKVISETINKAALLGCKIPSVTTDQEPVTVKGAITTVSGQYEEDEYRG